MKQLLALAFLVISFVSGASCSKWSSTQNNNLVSQTGNKMKIKIGDKSFTATLYYNQTAIAFKALLPLTVSMIELNGNEKYIDLSSPLPVDATNLNNIKSGDLMLYGSSTLVLFYKNFSTTYHYTRIGRVEDALGLDIAIGSGNVNVSFEIE